MKRVSLLFWQLALLLLLLGAWHVLTAAKILDPFFFATPIGVIERTIKDIGSGVLWRHLWITGIETLFAFIAGTTLGIAVGLWLGLANFASALLDPFIKAANAVPRVVLAPIFALWFGLGIWSKVALGFTLVFFVVFFNVWQGMREVSPVVLANARMLGMNGRQQMRHVYLPSALAWVFSSLHTAVGFALVGAVVGEYLGAAAGIGYRIAQAEGVFDTTGVFSGILVLTVFVILVDGVVTFAERRLMKWQPRAATETT
jgi:NitT/TauT family transport system permease protein